MTPNTLDLYRSKYTSELIYRKPFILEPSWGSAFVTMENAISRPTKPIAILHNYTLITIIIHHTHSDWPPHCRRAPAPDRREPAQSTLCSCAPPTAECRSRGRHRCRPPAQSTPAVRKCEIFAFNCPRRRWGVRWKHLRPLSSWRLMWPLQTMLADRVLMPSCAWSGATRRRCVWCRCVSDGVCSVCERCDRSDGIVSGTDHDCFMKMITNCSSAFMIRARKTVRKLIKKVRQYLLQKLVLIK